MDVYQLIVNDLYQDLGLMIIPTVMIPLTAVSVFLTMVATFIAGLFGIQLKAEGPKKLLEVLLKPRILAGAFILNGLIFGGIWAYEYVNNLPTFLYRIESTQKANVKPSDIKYENVFRRAVKSSINNTAIPKTITLEEQWKTKLPRGIFRAPTLSSERLFAGGIDGNVYELNSLNGEVIRRFFIGTFIAPATAISDNHLFFGEGTHATHHARIYKFSLKTGDYVESYETLGHTEGSPVIAEDGGKRLLFALAGSDGIHAINVKTMKRAWKANDGHVDASVYVENDKVFSGTGREKGHATKYKSYAVAYDFSSGKRLWKSELPASSWMSSTGWKDNVCFVFGEVYFKSDIGGVYCFNQETGKPTRSFNLAAPVTGMPTVVKDTMLVSDIHGRVCSLNLSSSNINWCREFKSKGKSYASPVYDAYRNVIAYASKNHGFHVLDTETGETIAKWSVEAPKSNSSDDKNAKKPPMWRAYFAGAVPVKDGYIIGDITGNIRKISIK